MINDFIANVIVQSIMITSFVLAMMLIIEYVNVQSNGKWYSFLKKSPSLQIFVAAILGIIPGCLGSYTVVSFFTHNILSFGALVTAMIATSGDEAYFMFALMPEKAIILHLIIFGVAIVTGYVIHFFTKQKMNTYVGIENHMSIHSAYCNCFVPSMIIPQFKKMSFTRALFMLSLSVFVVLLLVGAIGENHNHGLTMDLGMNLTEMPADTHDHAHDTEVTGEHSADDHNNEAINWVNITFLVLSMVALFIVSTVPDHFLEEHLWGHILKKHLLKVFLWTVFALAVIMLIKHYFVIGQWISANHFTILIMALLIGIIPSSGPHMIFISLFLSGNIPLSILVANSIVQDGHGAIPLFAESKTYFFKMKLVNVIVGALVGATGLIFGW